MSAQHTPGPWIAREWRHHSPTTVVREVNGEIVPIADVDAAGSGYLNDPETIANARLIAAAPDLLDALRELLHSDQACVEAAAAQARWDVAADRRRKAVAQARILIDKVDGC